MEHNGKLIWSGSGFPVTLNLALTREKAEALLTLITNGERGMRRCPVVADEDEAKRREGALELYDDLQELLVSVLQPRAASSNHEHPPQKDAS